MGQPIVAIHSVNERHWLAAARCRRLRLGVKQKLNLGSTDSRPELAYQA